MRFVRFGVALAAFSPAFLLLALGVWGRWATFGIPPVPSESATYAQRLRAYRTFVLASRAAEAVHCGVTPLQPQAYRALWEALDAAKPAAMPAIESSLTTPPARDDVRKPILEAEVKTFASAKKAVDGLVARGEMAEAALVMAAMHRLTLVARSFDFSPFVCSSNQRAQLAELLKRSWPLLSAEDRQALAKEIKDGERLVRPPYDIMRNDVLLLRLDFANTAQTTPREMAIPRVADEACRRAIDGQSIEWYLTRISKWPQSQDRDRLWQLLASWEIMLKRHESDRKRLFEAIGSTAS